MSERGSSAVVGTPLQRIKSSATVGLKGGFRTWLWLIRITVIITFLITVLQWAGVIWWLGEALAPVFAPFGLSAGGVMVFVTTSLANIYAGIGTIATLGIEYREAVILGVMGLVCHNLIMETVIQKKSGASGTAMVVLRVVGALVLGFLLNLIFPVDYSGALVLEGVDIARGGSFWAAMEGWALNMLSLLPFMLLMVVGLNVMQRVLAEFGVLDVISRPFNPMMWFFGLRRGGSVMWLILNTLGLAYGGSVMISQRREGELSLEHSKLLNTHIAISHSLLEDTILYLAIGLPLLWLLVPRLVLAIVAVWIQRLYYRIKKQRR